jgi:hypothetical protein
LVININLKLIIERVPNKIEYKLYVSSFTPQTGSIRGGNKVVVYGEGFRYNFNFLFLTLR